MYQRSEIDKWWPIVKAVGVKQTDDASYGLVSRTAY
jgi:hypothetical protein